MITGPDWLDETEIPSIAPLPIGRASLFDMINLTLREFVMAARWLSREWQLARQAAKGDPNAIISQEYMNRLSSSFSYVRTVVENMKLDNAKNRVDRLHYFLYVSQSPRTYGELESQLNVLQEAIDDDVKKVDLYHYPPNKVEMLRSIHKDWNATIGAFPSAGDEIIDAIDCFAVGHNTAAIFHLMRVAEYGLRALARERGVTFPKHPLEWADWQNILEQTEAKARDATKGMARGPAKDAALAFYSGAIGQFHAFKDTYRNVTMHVRRRYDELDALRAINQVRDFMNALSVKIGEKTRGPIRRWP